MKQILVDDEASVDILSHDAFLKIGYSKLRLTPCTLPIYGFNGVESKVAGIILLPITIGQELNKATQMM